MSLILRIRARFHILTPQDYLLNQRRASVIKDIQMRVLKPLQKANQGPVDTIDEVKLMGVAKGIIEVSLITFRSKNYRYLGLFHIMQVPKSRDAFYPDRFFEEVEKDGCDLVFLQIDPSEYMARQRHIAHKCALGNVEDFREDGVDLIDPIKPLTFQETVINPLSLDLMFQNAIPKQINYCEGFYTYSSPELQKQERKQIVSKLFVDAISAKILGGKRTEYPIIDRILYTSLMARHKVMLGAMPQTLYKLILGKGLSVGQARDMFRTILLKNRTLTIPLQPKEAASVFMPHIFQLPKDLYMTALIREAFQAATQIVATVDIAHIVPIQSYWISPPYGINMTEATYIPDGMPGESVEDSIEKQAILDVLLSTRTWGKSYLSNPFPYLFDDITKVKTDDLNRCKALFLKHYHKYSEFLKLQLQKLPNPKKQFLLTKEDEQLRLTQVEKMTQKENNDPVLRHLKQKTKISIDSRKILKGKY